MSLVLIVEDNERNLKLVRDVLQAKGYATLEAGTAEAGLRLARERSPALILMDIHLPGMNGIEALKQLRAEAATAAIPVIAITASVMQESVREVMAAGFEALIEKPIEVLGFLEKVRRVLERPRP
jgi:two-component system cell cycle response regulator DivK